jgi:hypothetical protein
MPTFGCAMKGLANVTKLTLKFSYAFLNFQQKAFQFVQSNDVIKMFHFNAQSKQIAVVLNDALLS